jgi:hypothetical protein
MKQIRHTIHEQPERAPDMKRWLVTYGRGAASFVRTFKDKDSARAYADKCTKLGWTAKVSKPKA